MVVGAFTTGADVSNSRVMSLAWSSLLMLDGGSFYGSVQLKLTQNVTLVFLLI